MNEIKVSGPVENDVMAGLSVVPFSPHFELMSRSNDSSAIIEANGDYLASLELLASDLRLGDVVGDVSFV